MLNLGTTIRIRDEFKVFNWYVWKRFLFQFFTSEQTPFIVFIGNYDDDETLVEAFWKYILSFDKNILVPYVFLHLLK